MNILIADKFQEWGIKELRDAGCEVVYEPTLEGDALRQAVESTGCNVLVVRSTRVPRQSLEASKTLSLVIRAGSGYDTIDVAAATQRNIRVCNCPGMNSVAVAELTIGLMLALDRRIVDETNDLRRGVWNKKEYSKARGLKGRTLGIVGLGRIGYEVAKRAAAFDMKLIYADVIEHKEVEEELGIRKVAFERLLAEADFVTLHTPGGETTKHLIGQSELAMMKPTAFVLNCSRGGIVDEVALAAAVEAGTIGGAALDVYEIEPVATGTEFKDPVMLARDSNLAPALVYGTHHVGASTEQAQNAVAEEAVRIVRGYIEEGVYLNCVNPK